MKLNKIIIIFIITVVSYNLRAEILNPNLRIEPANPDLLHERDFVKPTKKSKINLNRFFVSETGLIACGILKNDKIILETNEKNTPALYNNDGIQLFKVFKEKWSEDQSIIKYRNNLDKLISYFEYGLKKSPVFFPFHYNIATFYLRKRNYLKAKIHFHKAWLIIPNYSNSLIGLGRTYEFLGNKTEAANSYKKAIVANPYSSEASVALANLYFKENNFPRSILYYKNAGRISPEKFDGIIGLGKIAYLKNQTKKAFEYFREINFSKMQRLKMPYDRAAHYYYAKVLFDLRKYRQSKKQFDEILRYPEDVFFIRTPYTTVKQLRRSASILARAQQY